MAQEGDTITYTDTGFGSVSEDISAVSRVTVEYIKGAGGGNGIDENFETVYGGNGGYVENTVIDVSNESTLYIWVGDRSGDGRYPSGSSDGAKGGWSTEIAFVNTDDSDSDDEPHLAGAGGGSAGGSDSHGGRLSSQPLGGPANLNSGGEDGEGHVASRSEIINSGTTVTGGGSGPTTRGEIKLSYSSGPPYTVEVNGTEVKTIEVNGTEVKTIEVNGTEI